jgi:hypothetical protein
MAETPATPRGTSETLPAQTAPEDALLNLRSEIVKQISSELNHEREDGAFAKYVIHTKIPGT